MEAISIGIDSNPLWPQDQSGQAVPPAAAGSMGAGRVLVCLCTCVIAIVFIHQLQHICCCICYFVIQDHRQCPFTFHPFHVHMGNFVIVLAEIFQ